MKLEGVITCVNYSDFLAATLPENLPHFERLVVVTRPDDHNTKSLCQKYSVECVETECFQDEGDAFNKGRGINLGLGHLRGLGWILHLDADIVLPHRFRDLLYRARLEKDHLYGADRVNVYGYDRWEQLKSARGHYASRYFIDAPKEHPLGARIVHFEHGYTPIGYFQLWHRSANRRYPIHQGNAEHTDVLFSAQWPRAKRVLLPEVIVYHLESGHGPVEMGKNWNGRKTPPFGKYCSKCHHHGHHHACHCHCHHHHPKPYCPKPHGGKS